MSLTTPQSEEAQFQQANLALKLQKFQEAISLYTNLIKKNSHLPLVHNNLALCLQQMGEKALAKRHFEEAVRQDPDCYMALCNLGEISIQEKQYQKAIDYFSQANLIEPMQWPVYAKLAECYQAINLPRKILDLLNNAPSPIQQLPNSYFLLGCVYQQLNQISSAQKNYEKSVKLSPDYFEAHFNLSCLLYTAENWSLASKHLQKCLHLSPNHDISGQKLLECLLKQGNYKSAIALAQSRYQAKKNISSLHDFVIVVRSSENYQQVLQTLQEDSSLFENNPQYYLLLATIHLDLSEHKTAYNYFKHGWKLLQNSKLNADEATWLSNLSELEFTSIVWLAQLSLEHCDWRFFASLEPTLEKLIELQLNHQNIHPISPLLSTYLIKDYQTRCKIIKNFAAQFNLDPKKQFAKKISQHVKIRIGYISPDFNNNALGILLRNLFSYHSLDRFDIYLYSLKKTGDKIEQQIRSSVKNYKVLAGLIPVKAAELIYADEIDILVDLAGFTAGSKPEILAYQPASIQCHAWGFPGSLQLQSISYHINHPTVIAKNDLPSYQEKVLFTHTTPLATTPFVIPEQIPDKDFYKLPDNKFIFANFCRGYRINKDVFECWLEILKQVPNSILWLSAINDTMKHNLLKFASEKSIDLTRLYFMQREPITKNWPICHVDLWLDTFTLSSGTATLLCNWAGTPMLTKLGEHAPERMSAGYLQAANLEDLIVHSNQAYIDKAVYLGKNPKCLAKLKQKIIANKKQSNLFNSKKFILELESIYVRLVEKRN